MKLSLSLALLLGAITCHATAATPSKLCQDYNIPVNITSENYIFGPRFKDDPALIDFLTDATTRVPPNQTPGNPFVGQVNQTASYTISATFCSPGKSSAAHKNTVLLASHGLNFDRNYWNAGIHPEKYSFVDFAIGQGYSVFFYDRLGVGKSTTVSGYTNQASIQTAILQSLAHSVRAGQYTGSIGKPTSLVLIGHSFGSGITAAVAAAEPDIADGVVLTGFSYDGNNPAGFLEASGLRIAAKQSPDKWRQLDNGYVTLVDILANINVFFKAPDYDIAVVKYADTNKQPMGILEPITLGLLDLEPLTFTGVAMVIAGQRDFIFCTSLCDDIIGVGAGKVFSHAKAFKAVSYPGAGHGLNFAANATGAYGIITDFLSANGL